MLGIYNFLKNRLSNNFVAQDAALIPSQRLTIVHDLIFWLFLQLKDDLPPIKRYDKKAKGKEYEQH